MICNKISISQL